MSYATTSHYEAEILFRNRLAPPPEPTMGNNPGRNTPLNRTDDTKGCGSKFTRRNWRGVTLVSRQRVASQFLSVAMAGQAPYRSHFASSLSLALSLRMDLMLFLLCLEN